MTPIVDFLPYLLPFAPSVPEPIALQYIRLACIEFCKRSRSWRDVTEFDVSGQEEEGLPTLGQSSLFEIERAWFRSSSINKWEELTVKPFVEIDQSLYDIAPTQVTPKYISQISHDAVTLVPLAIGLCKISMFLMPSQDADAVPDILFKRFAQEISDGALAKIMMIPDQPYTNPTMAAFKDAAFNSACDSAFRLNIRGQQRASARAKSSYF